MRGKPDNPYLNLEPELPCPRCSEIFTQTAPLYQHMRENHSTPNKCHVCNHYFSCMASLLSHSYIHSGATPFKCGYPDCDYGVRTKQNIKVHMHFCTKCPAKKYRVAFPLPDRYKSHYKYQSTPSTKPRRSGRIKRRRSTRPTKRTYSWTTKPDPDLCANRAMTMSPKRTRAWRRNNEEDEDSDLLASPPSKRYIKTGTVYVEKPGASGWRLEMHKCITTKSAIVSDAIKLISTGLNQPFVGANCQPKGLHVAVLRDNGDVVQSAAIINTKADGNYIEIKSFATSVRHKRKHLGTLLIAFILERCSGRVIAGARDDIAVISFWRSIGFKECPHGFMNTFRRHNVVMMQTVAPYSGIYQYALNKFTPNCVVKKVVFKDKIREKGANTVTRVTFQLIARRKTKDNDQIDEERKENEQEIHDQTTNSNRAESEESKEQNKSRDFVSHEPPLKRRRKRYHSGSPEV